MDAKMTRVAIGWPRLLLAGLPVAASAQDDELVFYVVTHGSSRTRTGSS